MYNEGSDGKNTGKQGRKEIMTSQNTHKEIHEGVAGNGTRIYLVVTVRDSDGSWLWTERFVSKSEAECWAKFA